MGSTIASAWDGIVNGRSGIRAITKHGRERLSGANRRRGRRLQCRGLHVAEGHPEVRSVRALRVRRGGPGGEGFGHRSHRSRTRRGSAWRSAPGIGGLSTIEENTAKWLEAKSPRKISPFFIPGSIINAAAGQVSIHYGMRGPNLALVTACTTSTHSIGIGGALHPVRRRRRDGRRRRGNGVHAARASAVLRPGQARCRCATTSPSGRADPGIATGTAS